MRGRYKMTIKGLQKLTLLDYPGTLAATVFLGGCSFRCPFCHNASLVLGRGSESVTEEELLSFLKRRQGVLEGVCITGGEPTVHKGLRELIIKIRELGYKIKLDTNGYQPEVLIELCESGLVDYVAMDIKAPRDNYQRVSGLFSLDISKIEGSVNYLINNFPAHEFRTTVVRELHTAEDIIEISRWLKGESRYYIQSFIDSGDILEGGLSAYPKDELEAMLLAVRENLPNAELRGI